MPVCSPSAIGDGAGIGLMGGYVSDAVGAAVPAATVVLAADGLVVVVVVVVVPVPRCCVFDFQLSSVPLAKDSLKGA